MLHSEAGSQKSDGATPKSARKALTLVLAALVELALLVAAFEMALGFGFSGPAGPMPAPMPGF